MRLSANRALSRAAESLLFRSLFSLGSMRWGIKKVRLARNGALLAMVGSVHWKPLIDLLGICDTIAQLWHVAVGGDRASDVASRLKQNTTTRPK